MQNDSMKTAVVGAGYVGIATAVGPGTPLLVMRAEEASLVKNTSNVFLALRLTFANEVAGLAEDLGVDVGPVLERIGHACMRPSYGFVGAIEPG